MEIFGVSLPGLLSQLLLGLVNGSFYAILSLGLAVIFGLLNVINFAHGALFMMGAVITWMAMNYFGINYWLMLVLAPLVVGVFGVVIERLLLRWIYKLDHLYGLLLTLGLTLLIEGIFRSIYGVSGLGYDTPELLEGATNLGFMIMPNYRAWVVVASITVCIATWYVIEKTKLGAYLRAGTENPRLVEAFGVNVPLMITLTYAFGAALAAFAGVLAAPVYQVSPLMGQNLIIVVFAVVVIGGMGSIMGSILTGLGLGIVEGFTKVFYPEASSTVVFVTPDSPRRPVRQRKIRGCPHEFQEPFRYRLRPVVHRPAGGPVAGRLPGVRDEAAVLRTVRLGLQSAARLHRHAVLRPCGLFGWLGLRGGPVHEGVGLYP